ncbi:MAG: efflux RND transporter permease subunit [Pseudomonadota bacterium]
MTGIVDWATGRARMIVAFVLLSIAAGVLSYVGLPKEGEPDIEVPVLFVSVPFPGISAEDSEKLLVKPLETAFRDLDGLKEITATAAEGYAGVALEFDFGWDKSATLADVRDKANQAEAEFPSGAEQYSITEINFSEFPILVVSLSGEVPERTLLRQAEALQDEIEGLPAILEAALTGHRDEMLEVLFDPLRLEAYNITASELLELVTANNQLIAAGEVEGQTGAFSVKIPSAFDGPRDVMALPVKVNGDRVLTLGDLADIRLTFEDREGTARFNGEKTVALQVVKRKGFNVIETSALVRETVTTAVSGWPEELQSAIQVDFTMDRSTEVASMVGQLEASVLTAVALVMIVVLASLGIRSALLVGFAIPTSFLLCFALLNVFGIAISNIVMFGLILAVGMLVDGAIVVVEYADKEIRRGIGPMRAYGAAAKRMFWPIISSTATTLCAFMPMLFWPGIAGEFMGNLPMTLIFVLSASLVVALVYLPVIGGLAGRLSRTIQRTSDRFREAVPWPLRALAALLPMGALAFGFLLLLRATDVAGAGLGLAVFAVAWMALAVIGGSIMPKARQTAGRAGYRRSVFGWVIHIIAGNPVMPFAALLAVGFFVVSIFGYFGQNNNGVEFFVETEPERAVAYVRARGNLSLEEKDALVAEVEDIIAATPGVASIFAFAGDGGLTQGPGAQTPKDSIGQVQIELDPWEVRYTWGDDGRGNAILAEINTRLADIPGIVAEISEEAQGPAQGKPVHLRLKSDDWPMLLEATGAARAVFEATPGLVDIDDTRPLPGIDWQIDVDVETAGRFGADVATVGAMVQLVTRGLLLDTMRLPTSTEEIDIRARLPEGDRVLSTLDRLAVRTNEGLVPLSNFIDRSAVAKLGQIDRSDAERFFDVKADIEPGLLALRLAEETEPRALLRALETLEGADLTSEISGEMTGYRLFSTAAGETAASVVRHLTADDAALQPVTPNERIELLTTWAETLPPGISWEWTGDQEEQEESMAFLMGAFLGALGLMFVILLAQFNSLYNALLVLLAVIMSVTGSLIGMLVMDQKFSIIMTGTGIVALAGIVVNNNIVLIDTYQDYKRYMAPLEAIVRTAEDRIRPVLLTTITTMAGLAPMMFGVSVDFAAGGYTVDAPTALWWKQLATAVVFGLGIATVLTLVVTPALLAVRIWVVAGAGRVGVSALALLRGSASAAVRDRRLTSAARKAPAEDVIWANESVLLLRDPIFAGRPRRPQAAE